MTRQLSPNFLSAVNAQETSEAFIFLLTISHPNFTQSAMLSSDPTEDLPEAQVRGTISRGDEFVYLPFNITLPNQDDSGVSRAMISIDNISSDIIEIVRNANSSLSVKIEVVLASDPDEVEISIEDFKLDKINYDAQTISGELSLEFFELEPFPSKRFTPSDFPGAF